MTIYIKGKPVGEIDLGMDYLERGQPAWVILDLPRATPKPFVKKKNRGPVRTKLEWALISVESDEQRRTRQAAERTAKILRTNPYMEIAVSTVGACDRAARIRTGGVC